VVLKHQDQEDVSLSVGPYSKNSWFKN